MTRALRASFLTMAGLVATGLAVALFVGAPHPALIERAAAAAFGALGLGAGLIALSVTVAADLPAPARRARLAEEPSEAGATALFDLERSLRVGSLAAGDFHAHVRPRLVHVAASRLARGGVALSDHSRAVELLGAEAYALVDPAGAPPGDRFGPGVALARVGDLLDKLEALGEPL
jgi:hypothetical protein